MLEQATNQDLNRVVNILSIAIVTLLILLILNIYKVHKLKTKLKALENN